MGADAAQNLGEQQPAKRISPQQFLASHGHRAWSPTQTGRFLWQPQDTDYGPPPQCSGPFYGLSQTECESTTLLRKFIHHHKEIFTRERIVLFWWRPQISRVVKVDGQLAIRRKHVPRKFGHLLSFVGSRTLVRRRRHETLQECQKMVVLLLVRERVFMLPRSPRRRWRT